jgi:hypothetical protein
MELSKRLSATAVLSAVQHVHSKVVATYIIIQSRVEQRRVAYWLCTERRALRRHPKLKPFRMASSAAVSFWASLGPDATSQSGIAQEPC